MSKNLEQTLILFKPDSLQRGLVGEILTRFEKVGLRIVGTKMLAPDSQHYFKHYEEIGTLKTRAGDKIFDITLEMMSAGPVIAMVFEGVEAVALVRKMVGATEPKSSAPGTIRADFADSIDANAVHGSDAVDAAAVEVSFFFPGMNVYSR